MFSKETITSQATKDLLCRFTSRYNQIKQNVLTDNERKGSFFFNQLAAFKDFSQVALCKCGS